MNLLYCEKCYRVNKVYGNNSNNRDNDEVINKGQRDYH